MNELSAETEKMSPEAGNRDLQEAAQGQGYAFCAYCGRKHSEGARFCPGCGKPVVKAAQAGVREDAGWQAPPDTGAAAAATAADTAAANGTENKNDAPSFGFALLGFIIPVVGLVLYLVWREETPLRAGSAGKGALFGVIAGIALSILLPVLSAMIFGNILNSLL